MKIWLQRIGFIPVALIVVAIPAAISGGLLWHGLHTRSGSSIALGAIGCMAWLFGLVVALRPRKRPESDGDDDSPDAPSD